MKKTEGKAVTLEHEVGRIQKTASAGKKTYLHLILEKSSIITEKLKLH